MISAEQNDFITRVGRDAPAGKLLRRYWQPVALADELAGPRPVKPVKLMGQDFVLFRDESGQLGMLDRDCPHRGADLAFGRLENGGIRCAFHGWLFDAKGKCLETPAEPATSKLCAASSSARIPVVEKGGVLFAYLGEGEPPAFPDFDCFAAPGQPHLRLQGPVRMQLAAGARSRHRSRARLVPAPLLRGRGHVKARTASSSAAPPRAPTADDQDPARI
jgi:phthalate 4,5-dioxygenase oxygenase subunit